MMAAGEGLVIRTGPLIEAIATVDPSTIPRAAELSSVRRAHAAFRPVELWTSDLAVYSVRDDGAGVLFLAPREANFVLAPESVQVRTDELIVDRNVVPTHSEERAVRDAALNVSLASLDLTDADDEMSFFEIPLDRYDSIDGDRRRLAQGVYGCDPDWQLNMECMRDHGATTLRVYVLNPEYVRRQCPDGRSIARLGRLDRFPRANFRAVGRNIGDPQVGLCGRGASGRIAPRPPSVAEALQVVLAHPARARERMTPEHAAALGQSLLSQRDQRFDGYIHHRGPLKSSFGLLEPSTIQHAAEITTARRTVEAARGEWFWTAEAAVYGREGDEDVVYLSTGASNPILTDAAIGAATDALSTSRNHVIQRADVDASSWRRLPYRELRVTASNHEFCHLTIDLAHPPKEGTAVRQVLGILLGDAEFAANRDFLRGWGIDQVDVFLLNPDYLRREIGEDAYLARMCRLGKLSEKSVFKAVGRVVGSPYVSLRGQLRLPSRPPRLDVEKLDAALERVTQDPAETARHLNDTIRPLVVQLAGE